jgi:hypothetical protein
MEIELLKLSRKSPMDIWLENLEYYMRRRWSNVLPLYILKTQTTRFGEADFVRSYGNNLAVLSGESVFIECYYQLMGETERLMLPISVFESNAETESRKREMRALLGMGQRAPANAGRVIGRKKIKRTQVHRILVDAPRLREAVKELQALGLSRATAYRECERAGIGGKKKGWLSKRRIYHKKGVNKPRK